MKKVNKKVIDILTEVGVKESDINAIIQSIKKHSVRYPNKPINIKKILKDVKCSNETVKNTLFTLYILRCISSTFTPIHKKCGKVVGKEEKTYNDIIKKLKKYEYRCSGCHIDIGKENIDMIMNFRVK